eukprot:gene2604-3228_t
MEQIIRINWIGFDSESEVKKAIFEWYDRDIEDECQINRMDILKLIDTHGLGELCHIKYSQELGLFEIYLSVDAKPFYGIQTKWGLFFKFSELGDHIISMDIKRIYQEIKSNQIYNFNNNNLQVI